VQEEVLPVRSSYSKELLKTVTTRAGLSDTMAEDHIDDNFAFNPSGFQDIFNMEGASNEHMTSTGINDCSTTFENCHRSDGQLSCTNFTSRSCGVPSLDKFNSAFNLLDTDHDDRLHLSELLANAGMLPAVDANAFGLGSIPGSFSLIIQIFGETPSSITKDRMRVVLIDRMFPAGFYVLEK